MKIAWVLLLTSLSLLVAAVVGINAMWTGAVGSVLVRSRDAADAAALRDVLLATGATVTSDEPGVLQVSGVTAGRIGDLALDRGVAVHELTPRRASLEEAYLELTREAVEYR